LFATKSNSLGAEGGIGVNFKSFTDGLLAYEGTLNAKTDSLESSLKRNGTDQDKVLNRASTLESRLLAQYTALDVKMASLNALDAYVTQQVASWNKSTS
jgi:flagellar hook-associated protein 2